MARSTATDCERPRSPAIAFLFLAVLLSTFAHAAPREVFVSPAGDDRGAGDEAGPLATIARAVQAVRELRTAADGPITVYLRGGTYELREPLVFAPADTGTAASPVTYASLPGERAVISGGRRITGTWRQTPGKAYWQVDVPEARDGRWSFNSLYVNGMSRTRARKPNWGSKVLRAKGRAPGEDERQAFAYFPGDIDATWTNLTDIDIVLLCSWTPTIHRITEVLPDRRVVRFQSSHARSVDFWEKNFRYYVANVFEELDEPGEWYLNRRTGILYYYPLPDEDMATADVVAPVLKSRLVTFDGDPVEGKFIEHLTFRDLDFRHVDGDLDRYNGVYRQGHMFLDAAIYAKGLRNCVFRGCEIAQLGEYAIELAEGCCENRIERCRIHDIGAGAMQIGVTDLGTLLRGGHRVRPGDIVLEAESAVVSAPFVRREDRNASGGAYVVLPEGADGEGTAVFAVPIEAAGEFTMLARVIAPSGSADSFYVQINDGPRHTYDTGTGQHWFLSKVVARELDGKSVTADLAPGRNRITVISREPGARLDQLVLRASQAGDEAEAERGKVHALRNVIDNNIIHRLGTLWHGCYGIVNRFASFTQITHNDISDIHWDAIGLDARWNYNGETYSHGNVVAYNHLHHLGLRYHTDAGGVYQYGPLDTHIHHNLIHDTVAYPYICGYAGVYLDEQSRNAVVENNLVYNVEWPAYFQHKGVDNTFRNNIGAFARDGLIHRGGLNETWKANHLEAYRNIYISRDGVALGKSWQPGLRPPVLRENMYFSLSTGTDLTFAGKSFAEWQAEGQDAGSIPGDPGCVDPAAFDFTLKPDAPALSAIGFKPFDAEIAKAGVYGSDEWRNLPKTFTRRTPSDVWTPDDLARLVAFSVDFEDMPDGHEPSVFNLKKEGDATFAVSSEAAASGSKSYRCVDRKGLQKPFYPYIHLAPRKLGSGKVVFRFDAMLAGDNPAPFYVEFRGSGSVDDVGPSVYFGPDGRVIANGAHVCTVDPGNWCYVEIVFELGADSAKEYTLTTRNGGTEQTRRLPFRHDTFSEIRWLGISAYEDGDGVFYLDNMELQLAE